MLRDLAKLDTDENPGTCPALHQNMETSKASRLISGSSSLT